MAVKLESGFEILRVSDLSYEGMTTEIQYKDEQVARLNMDKGWDSIEIELFTQFAHPDFKPVFQIDAFLDAVNKATKILKEYEK